MEHLANEFMKVARDWNDLTIDEQREYLKRHPASKRRLNAKPRPEGIDSKEFEEMIGSKKIVAGVDRLNSLLDKINKRYIKVPRAKVSWVLENSLKGKKPENEPKTYDLSKNEENDKITEDLNKRIAKLTSDAEKLIYKRQSSKQATEAVSNYIKQNFVVLKDAKDVKNLKEMQEFKAPKAEVKKVETAKPDYFGIGHRVKLSNGIEGTIVDVKHGHKYTTVKVTTDDGRHWSSKQNGSSYSSSNMKFLGQTVKNDAERIRDTRQDFDQALQNRKHRRAEDGREKIDLLKINPGDKIKIKGSDYNWVGEVVSVDHAKGGVRINQVRQRRQRGSFDSGFFSPGNTTQHYRFIPAAAIVGKE